MPVADHTYDASMVEAALARTAGVTTTMKDHAGQSITAYQYGPMTNPDPAAGFRSYRSSGKGVGHVYVHVEGGGNGVTGHNSGLARKSRYEDQKTAVGVLVEILAHPLGRAALQRLDANPGTQEWLHGADGVPINGPWYGYAQNSTAKQKIKKASVNLRSHGDALFISSSYPEEFHGDGTT